MMAPPRFSRVMGLIWSLLGVMCIQGLSLAQGKGQGVEVRALSPKLQDASPGQIVSLSFLVTNRSEQEEEFIESLRLPEGWRAVIPTGSLRLRPGEATTRLMAFQVPQGTPAGRYEITYGVRSQRDYAIQDADTVTIAVLPVTKLALLLEDKPESVIAGESYEIKLRLVNQSNVELRVKVEVSSEEKYPARVEPAEVTLAAGASVPLLVTVQTDPKELHPRTHYVQVKAQAVNAENGETSAGITVGVEIIPRVTGEFDVYHRLPAEITLRLCGEDRSAAVQVEARGAGSLDEAGTRRVEFLLRAPNTQAKGTLGLYDEYRLNYSSDDWDVRLGDQTYGLSRLTSYYRYGRGLGVDYHPPTDPMSFGVYYLDERRSRLDRREGGVYVARRVSDTVLTRFHFLRREGDAYLTRPGFADTLWSLEVQSRPREDMSLRLEYAYCDTDRDGGADGDAYRIESDGRLGERGYYQVAKFHADPDYYGYYYDSDHSYASITYPLGPRLQGTVSYNRYKTNLDLRPDKGPADRETLWQAGVTYNLDDGWYLALNYDDFERYDAMLPRRFDFEERALRLGVGRSAQQYGFRVEVRAANQKDRLNAESSTVWNYNFFATYRPRRDTFFTLYAGFGDDEALEGGRLLRRSDNVGVSLAWEPRPDLSLDLWYTRYGFDAPDRPEAEQYSLRLRHRLSNGHQVALEARRNIAGLWDRETVYRLAYIIPIGLPVSRKEKVGRILGRVFDAEAPEHPGIAGAILRANGATAVTNPNGEFVFPSVAPGTYQIYVDRSSIGLDRVTQQRLPITVEVTGGEVKQIEIGVVRAAKLSGRVLVIPANENNHNGNNGDSGVATNASGSFVVGDPGNNTAREPTGLPNVLVELTNGQEVLRRVTDHRGEFLFESLRPGTWHLKVYDHNLPAYHYLETPEQDLTLEPGQSAEITIRVLPKVRQIRFIDEGVIRPNSHNR